MYFNMKSYLKNIYNHTVKNALNPCEIPAALREKRQLLKQKKSHDTLLCSILVREEREDLFG
jgi:hypothetical protein